MICGVAATIISGCGLCTVCRVVCSYSQRSHQHVSVGIAAIFTVMFLLQEYRRINLVNCVTTL